MCQISETNLSVLNQLYILRINHLYIIYFYVFCIYTNMVLSVFIHMHIGVYEY